jgi:hypothetical protein
MMRVSKAVCAEGEAPDSCQARQDAYQLMGKIQSAVIPDFEMNLVISVTGENTTMSSKGLFEFMLVDSNEGLGANIHAVITEGEITTAEGTQSIAGTEFIVVGNKGYTSEDGGQTWTYAELDDMTMLGLSMLLGLGGPTGASLDLYADPAIFAVTSAPTVDYEGQTMQVQTLAVDIMGLLGNSEALLALMQDGFAVTAPLGLDETQLGMPLDQFAMAAAFLGPFLTGTEANTTLYIGADDGYIHFVDENLKLFMDLSATDPTQEPMEMTYELTGHITQHNAELVIAEPTGATEGGGLFSGEGGLFGGGGLGDSLFGAQ